MSKKIVVPEEYKLNNEVIKTLHEKEYWRTMIVALVIRFDLTDYSKDQISLIAGTNKVKATLHHTLNDKMAIYSFRGSVKGVSTCLKEIFSLESDIELFYLLNEELLGEESVNEHEVPEFLAGLRELCLVGEIAGKLEKDFREYISKKLK